MAVGDTATKYLDPASDGIVNWSPFGVGGTSHYDKVDDGTREPTAPGTSTGLTAAADATVDNINCEALSGAWAHMASVKAVSVWVYWGHDVSGKIHGIQVSLTITDTGYGGAGFTPVTLSKVGSAGNGWSEFVFYSNDSYVGDLGYAMENGSIQISLTTVKIGSGSAPTWTVYEMYVECETEEDVLYVNMSATDAANGAGSPTNAYRDSLSQASLNGINTPLALETSDFYETGLTYPIGKVEVYCDIAGVSVGSGTPNGWLQCFDGASQIGTDGAFLIGIIVATHDVTSGKSWSMTDFESGGNSDLGVRARTTATHTWTGSIEVLMFRVELFEGDITLVVNETEQISEGVVTQLDWFQIINETEQIDDQGSALIAVFVSLADTEEIADTNTLAVIGLLAVLSNTVEISEDLLTAIGNNVVANETVEIAEALLAILGDVQIVSAEIVEIATAMEQYPGTAQIANADTVAISELIRKLRSVLPDNPTTPENNPSHTTELRGPVTELTRMIDTMNLSGQSPHSVKPVPPERQAHIDEKTVVHMDKMFRQLYRVVKELNDKLNEDDE